MLKGNKSRFTNCHLQQSKIAKVKNICIVSSTVSGRWRKCSSFSYEKKVEPGTKFVVNGNDIEGTMIIKTITNRFDLETFFVVTIFVLYIVVFLKLLYKLFK